MLGNELGLTDVRNATQVEFVDNELRATQKVYTITRINIAERGRRGNTERGTTISSSSVPITPPTLKLVATYDNSNVRAPRQLHYTANVWHSVLALQTEPDHLYSELAVQQVVGASFRRIFVIDGCILKKYIFHHYGF